MRALILCLPFLALLFTFCDQQQYNKELLTERFNQSDSAIHALVNDAKIEIMESTGDTLYNEHIQYILESAKFRLDSLEHSIDTYNRQSFERVEARIEQIIYQTEQDLLELKQVANEKTKSVYDELARGVKSS
ncbi:MAG: hypothetical protein MAGBODY4_01727 [Candidatus Marinimicrobia bacterium]|nr:hypothetical protein [Candidatus Neomarinimicrobiota bacterium]